jgi:hypothetical protein
VSFRKSTPGCHDRAPLPPIPPQTRRTSLELPRPNPVGAGLLEAFDVLSHCGPHALHVARLDDLQKHDVVGLHRAQMLEQPRQRQPAREIDRERIGFASSKDEERSLRLMLLIVVMDQRESINQHHRGLDGWSLRGTGRTIQLRSPILFMSSRPDATISPHDDRREV